MRRLSFFASLIAVLSFPIVARSNQEPLNAEDIIRATVAAYAGAWNNADAKTVSELYTTDADYTGFGSVMTRGRLQIEKRYAELLFGRYRGTSLAVTVSSIRFLKPDVAIVDGTLELTGLTDESGAPAPTDGLYIATMTQIEDRWLLTTFWSKQLKLTTALE